MAVARVRQTTNAAAVSSNTIAVSNSSWSPGATAGNLMLISLQLYGTATIGITTPTGWVLSNSGTATSSTTRNYTAILYRVATGTSADTLTSITTSGASAGRWAIEEYSGLASKSVVASTGAPSAYTTASSGTTITLGTPSPGVANTFTYGVIGQRLSAAPTAVTYAWTSGYTVGLAGNATAQNNLGIAYKSNTTSGSQGTFQVTQTTTGATNTAAEVMYMAFNQQSTITASYTNTLVDNVLSVTSSSTSTYTNLKTYAWDWGDGTTTAASTSTTASHTYTASGTYTVVLTVTDDKGQTATSSKQFTVAIDLAGWIATGSAVYPGTLFYWDGTAKRPLGASAKEHYNLRGGVYYARFFTGTDNSTFSAPEWTVTAGGTGSSAKIVSNALQLQTAASAWSGGPQAFLSGLTGIDDFEMTFRLSLADLSQQYPLIGIRLVDDQVYAEGAGAGLPKTGYAIVFGPNDNAVQIQNGYIADNNNPIAQFAYTFSSPDNRVKINATQKVLSMKIWPSSQSEPAAWTYQASILQYQNSGRFLFRSAAGGTGVASTVTIDSLRIISTRQQPALLDTQPAPVGNLTNYRQILVENFDTYATPGAQMQSVYANSWQPYPDGTGGMYYSGTQVSAHDGVLDTRLDGVNGAAGVFGTASDAYNRLGGRFAMRAKAIGGDGNGTAVMVYPSNDNWDEGEIDYPEANFETTPQVHHHVMNMGDNTASTDYDTTVSWRDWHIYAIEWIPGVSVKYYLDGVLLTTITSNVPTTPHRYMFQVGNYGIPGNFYIDWVSIWAYDTSITGDSVSYGQGTYGQGIYG